jgi:hypothetical protein
LVIVIVLCSVVIAGALQLVWSSYEDLNRALDQVADAHTSASMQAAMHRLQEALIVGAGAMLLLLLITIVGVIVLNRSLPRPINLIAESDGFPDDMSSVANAERPAHVVDIRSRNDNFPK